LPDVPIILPVGFILVYGLGVEQSQSGITPENTVFKFGSVYQIWDGGEVFVYGGDSVMFKESDVTCRLAIGTDPNNVYTMIPARLVTREDIPL